MNSQAIIGRPEFIDKDHIRKLRVAILCVPVSNHHFDFEIEKYLGCLPHSVLSQIVEPNESEQLLRPLKSNSFGLKFVDLKESC